MKNHDDSRRLLYGTKQDLNHRVPLSSSSTPPSSMRASLISSSMSMLTFTLIMVTAITSVAAETTAMAENNISSIATYDDDARGELWHSKPVSLIDDTSSSSKSSGGGKGDSTTSRSYSRHMDEVDNTTTAGGVDVQQQQTNDDDDDGDENKDVVVMDDDTNNRCGPRFEDRVCSCDGDEIYCNEESGKCVEGIWDLLRTPSIAYNCPKYLRKQKLIGIMVYKDRTEVRVAS